MGQPADMLIRSREVLAVEGVEELVHQLCLEHTAPRMLSIDEEVQDLHRALGGDRADHAGDEGAVAGVLAQVTLAHHGGHSARGLR